MKKIHRPKLITLNHNQNTNKNISINILMTSPKCNFLKQNFQNNNQDTSKSKKYQKKQQKIDSKQTHSGKQPKYNRRIVTTTQDFLNNSHQKQCQISIKVFKNKKSAVPDLAKASKKPTLKSTKTAISLKNKKKVESFMVEIPQSITNKGIKKIFFQSQNKSKQTTAPVLQFKQLRELYKQCKRNNNNTSKSRQRSNSRKCTKSVERLHNNKQIISNNFLKKILKKDEYKKDISTKSIKSLKKKTKIGIKQQTENLKTKQRCSLLEQQSIQKKKNNKKSKTIKQKNNNNYEKFQPFLLSNILNTTNTVIDGIKTTSELTSKQQSLYKIDPPLNIQFNKIINSIDLTTNIRYIRQMQRKQNEKQKRGVLNGYENSAAIIIQRWWRRLKKDRVLRYYNKIFNRIEYNKMNMDEQNNVDLEGQEFSQIQNEFLNDTIKNIYEQQQQQLQVQKKNNVQEEQQSQFDINKYQQFVQKSLKQQQDNQQQQIHKIKQKQLLQWNHINKLINHQLNNTNQINSQTLLQQLIKQSQLNKKWIENTYQSESSHQPNYSNQKTNTIPNSPSLSSRSHHYQQLIDQHGIIDKIKKNSSNLKILLCNTYQFQKYSKNQKKQRSIQHLKQSNSQKLQQLMTYQLTHDQQQQDKIHIPKYKQKNQLISKYLDCGLNLCGLEPTKNQDIIFTSIDDYPQQQSTPLKQLNGNNIIQKTINPIREAIQIIPPKPLQQQMNQQQLGQQTIYNNEWNKLNLQILIKNLNTNGNEENDQMLYKDKNDSYQQTTKSYNNNEQIIAQQIVNNQIYQFCLQIKNKTKFQKIFQQFNKPHIKGIKTSFPYIQHYLNQFIQYILRNQIQKKIVLKNINSVLGPTSEQMLYYMRIQDYSNYQESSSEEQQSLLIISLQTFQKFQAYYNTHLQKQLNLSSQPKNNKLLAYAHCWHRALFQGLNQALDYQRPYGTYGKPYAWHTESKIKNTKITEQTLQKKLDSGLNRILQTTSCLSGIMFQKEDNPFYGSNLLQQYKIQINEDRLARMLANQLLQTQQTWINYNDEITEILMEINHMISQKILFEVTVQLKKLNRKRSMMMQS